MKAKAKRIFSSVPTYLYVTYILVHIQFTVFHIFPFRFPLTKVQEPFSFVVFFLMNVFVQHGVSVVNVIFVDLVLSRMNCFCFDRRRRDLLSIFCPFFSSQSECLMVLEFVCLTRFHFILSICLIFTYCSKLT